MAEKILEMSMAQMSLDESAIAIEGGNSEKIKKLFTKEHKSTKVPSVLIRMYNSSFFLKIVSVLAHLDRVIESGDKWLILFLVNENLPNFSVIVSQWTSLLTIVEFHLLQKSITFTSITDEIKTADR